MTSPAVLDERPLGRGRLTRTTAAVDGLGRPVVVTRFDLSGPSAQDAVAAVLVQLEALPAHPALVPVREQGRTSSGQPWMLCPWRPSSLEVQLAEGQRWTVAEALAVIAGLAGGLAVLHEHGIVHGDIRPANVLVGSDDVAALADAGIHLADQQATAADPTRLPMGLAALTPPEMLRGDPVTPPTDSWWMGGLLHLLLTGAPPFEGPTREAVVSAAAAGRLGPRAADLPPALQELLRLLLAPDPTDRVSDGAELEFVVAAALRGWVADPPVQAEVVRPEEDQASASTRRPHEAPGPIVLPPPADAVTALAAQAQAEASGAVQPDSLPSEPEPQAWAPRDEFDAMLLAPTQPSAPEPPPAEPGGPESVAPAAPVSEPEPAPPPDPNATLVFDLPDVAPPAVPPRQDQGPRDRTGRRRALAGVAIGLVALLVLGGIGAAITSLRSGDGGVTAVDDEAVEGQAADVVGGPDPDEPAPDVAAPEDPLPEDPAPVDPAPDSDVPPQDGPPSAGDPGAIAGRIPQDGPGVTPPDGYRVAAGRGLEVAGPATDLTLAQPRGLAVGPDGSVYISDRLAHRVFRIDPRTQQAEVFAGTGHPVSDGDGGPADEASVRDPVGVAVAEAGVFIVERAGRAIRLVAADGTIRTHARLDDLPGGSSPYGIAVLPDEVLAVTIPGAEQVVAVDPQGGTEVIAESTDDLDLRNPTAIVADGADLLVLQQVTDDARVLRLTRQEGGWTVAAEVGDPLQSPRGLGVGPEGVYVSQVVDDQVVRLTGGTPEPVAGTTAPAPSDGQSAPAASGSGRPAIESVLRTPGSIAVAPDGDILLIERDVPAVVGFRPGGDLRLVAGHVPQPPATPAAARAIAVPGAVAADGEGRLAYTDTGLGQLVVVAGGTAVERLEGKPKDTLGGVAFGAAGVVYYTDVVEGVVYALDADGNEVIHAGAPDGGALGDGGPADLATLLRPRGLAWADGVLYIAEQGRNRIRAVAADGTITTIAGGEAGYQDGPAAEARFDFPADVAVAGNRLLVADAGNSVIREIDLASLEVTTILGRPGDAGAGAVVGPAAAVRLDVPLGVAVDGQGRVVVADTLNRRVLVLDGLLVDVVLDPADGLPQARPTAVAVIRDGVVAIADSSSRRVWERTY